jgi:hypothetical protein
VRIDFGKKSWWCRKAPDHPAGDIRGGVEDGFGNPSGHLRAQPDRRRQWGLCAIEAEIAERDDEKLMFSPTWG